MFLVRPFLTMAQWSRLDYGVYTWTEWGHLRPTQFVKLMQYSYQMTLLLCIFGVFLYFCTKLSDKWEVADRRSTLPTKNSAVAPTLAFHICRSEVLNCVPYLLLLSFELYYIFVVLMFWIVFHVCCWCVLNCISYLLLLSFELYFIFVLVFDCICFENT